MRRLGWLWPSLLVLSACSSEEQLFLSFPPDEGAAAMLLGVTYPDGSNQLFAEDLTVEGHKLELPLDMEWMHLEALLYFSPLEGLELTAGEIPTNRDGGRLGDLEPSPDFTYSAELDRDGVTAWVSHNGDLGSDVANIRFGEPPPCTKFERIEVPLPGVRDIAVRILERLPDGRVLAGDRDVLAIVDESGTAEAVTTNPPGLESEAAAAVADANGRILIGGEHGELWDATLSGTELDMQLITTSTPTTVLWLDGPHDSLDEAFMLQVDGTFSHFDGEKLVQIDTIETQGEESESRVVWIAPGEAIAVSRYIDAVVRFKGGRITREDFGLSGEPGFPGAISGTLAHGETYIGGSAVIARASGGGWVDVGVAPQSRVYGMAEYSDHMVVLGFNAFYEFRPIEELICDAVSTVTGDEQRFVTYIGDPAAGAIVVGGDGSNRNESSTVNVFIPIE